MNRILLKIGVSAVLLGAFLWRVPLDEVWENLRQLDTLSIAAAAALTLAACWLSAVRLWFLLPEFRLRELVHMTFVSIFYATVLPGQIAGDVVKAYRLGRRAERPGHAEAATLVDRAQALFALFVIGTAASFHAQKALWPLKMFMAAGALGIAILGLATSSKFFRHHLVERLLQADAGRIPRLLRFFSIALHDCLRRPLRMLANLTLALAFHLICVGVQVLLGAALQISLNWSDWAVVYAGVSIVTLLPVSIAGLGLREGGYIGLLTLLGVSSGIALSLSFTMFALILLGALYGAGLESIDILRARTQGEA